MAALRLRMERELREAEQVAMAEGDRAERWRELALELGAADIDEQRWEVRRVACDGLETAEVDGWDEATAARAQAEMIAAHRRSPGLWRLYTSIGLGPVALLQAAFELRSYNWG